MKQTARAMNVNSQVEDLEKNKDTIAFFDENAVETVQNRNIKVLPVPQEVKALSKRLDTIIGRAD